MIFGIRKQKKIWATGLTNSKTFSEPSLEVKSSNKRKKKTGHIGCPNCKGGNE